ncbi:MAG: ATP-binding protein [Bacteroidota bacterium]
MVKLFDLKKIDKRIEKIISYPGIGKNNLILRKNYWIASLAFFIVIVVLTFVFWLIYPEFKILLSYGLFLSVIFLEYLIAAFFVRENLKKIQVINQVLITVGTFLFILKLGGIPHSGGLIFVGFFVVLFSLDFKIIKYSVLLFIIYVITLVLAGILHPYLTVAPEMTSSANIFLFVVNLLWISAFAFLFVLNFISQRIEIEKKEIKLLKELNEIRTKLYTNITHEFRTPLTVIQGMTDLIRTNPDKWLHRGTRKIENNSVILLNYVNQMLDLSKLEAGAMTVSMIQGNIILYITYLVDLFRSLADSKKVTLQYFPENEPVLMDYDPAKLTQIISNLISNAVKYNKSGGKVEITTSINKSNGYRLEIKVRDNGIGIKEEELLNIFDRFYRGDKDRKNIQNEPGSGLGLALTLELIKLLGGTIRAESVYGKGTEFRVSLPVTNNASLVENKDLAEITGVISAPEAYYEEEGPLVEKKCRQNKPELLIVEDRHDIVEYLSALLEKDYCVQYALNGKEGWKKALDLSPDIILSDIMMPEMDGIEMLDKVKNDVRTSHIPVIVLTAKADIASRINGLKRGADAYISKPFNKEELMAQLNTLVELRKKLQKRYSIIGYNPVSKDADNNTEDIFIQKVSEFMRDNLEDDNFNINDLCYEVAMSRSQLYRKFKSLTNKTLFEYLQLIRLHKAKELLTTADINVSEAATLSGFKNLSHFSRAFTKEFGINPSKIKKM